MPATPAATRESGRTGTITAIGVVACAILVISFVTDHTLPTAADWRAVGVLGVVALIGAGVVTRFRPRDEDSTPPWSVHTVWLMPAALIAPPLGFAPLLALSLLLTFIRRVHRLSTRIAVSSITVMTTAEIHAIGTQVDSRLLAGVIAIVALHVTGTLVAILVAFAFTAPTGTATWLDYRWSFVQLGCEAGGILTVLAMAATPLAGFAALSPLLLSEFALNWPQLDRHARIDPKTGLPNARHWQDRSEDLISAASLHQVPVAVAMLDIDHFKTVNDTYGHLVGDDVLERLAATLRSQVGPGDVVGRFGGEEFVVTLFGLKGDDAARACERIRAAVAVQRHDPGRRDFTASADGEGAREQDPFGITCTIGLAVADSQDADLMHLLAEADRALAVGKVAGRNRVERAPDEEHGEGGQNPPTTSAWDVASAKRSWMQVAGQQRRTRIRDR